MNLSFQLEKRAEEPLYRQLYEQLREQILQGVLTAGTRLPSTRRLADRLSIARITVTQAYDQLQAEGYVTRKRGAGSFVASDLALQLPESQGQLRNQPQISLSDWGQRLMHLEHRSQ